MTESRFSPVCYFITIRVNHCAKEQKLIIFDRFQKLVKLLLLNSIDLSCTRHTHKVGFLLAVITAMQTARVEIHWCIVERKGTEALIETELDDVAVQTGV